jgi:hypothetical protein
MGIFNFGASRRSNDNQPPSIDEHARMIERILTDVTDKKFTRIQNQSGRGWAFTHGSARIEAYLTYGVDNKAAYLQVVAPIVTLSPESPVLPLYRFMLEENLNMVTAAFGIYETTIYIFYERPLEGLDAVEAKAIMTKIADYADDYDNYIVDNYGGRLYQQA